MDPGRPPTAETPMHYVKLAFRTLFRSPFVTTVAVVSLALGIGANAAIFSLIDQILLQPLAVPAPERLVYLTSPGPQPGFGNTNESGHLEATFSYPMYRDLERSQSVLTGLAAFVTVDGSFAIKGEPVTGDLAMVSGSYFHTLGLTPALGRFIGPDDDAVIGDGAVAVLSYAFWRGRLGGDRHVLGSPITVNGQTMTVVGVAPRDFDGFTFGQRPSLFVPLTMTGKVSGDPGFENRRSYWLYVFGRLKPDVTLTQAASALNGIYGPILRDVEAPLQDGMSDATMAQFKAKQIDVFPGYRGESLMHAEEKAPLTMLFAVTGLVLLIACANIANLLLARGAGRAKEMGVRLAIGAGRRRLVTQLLTESLLLGAMGAVVSLVVAALTLRTLESLLPAGTSSVMQFTLRPPALIFTAALALLTGILFGLFPALHSTRSEVMDAVRTSTVRIAGHRGARRFRSALVTSQLTLACGLLICAGLFLKSLVNVFDVDLGFRVDKTVTFTISPDRAGYDQAHDALLFQQVEDELARQPGVAGVATSAVPLLSDRNRGKNVNVEGFHPGPDADKGSRYNEVGPGYFAAMGIPIVAGRGFTAADRAGASSVAVVNQAFAKKFGLGTDAVGKFMSVWSNPLNIRIVGVVKDTKYSSVKDTVPPLFFIPWRQDASIGNTTGTLSFYVRSALPTAAELRTITPLIKRLAPGVPVEDLKTVRQQIRDNVFLDRLVSILSGVFASLATLLAAVGLYGVLAYTVQQRTREIGVRMALGADGARVRGLVMRQTGVIIGAGAVLGVAGALAAGRVLQSLLYQLKGYDPAVFGLALIALLTVSALASWIPALRASRVDPNEALRYE